MVSGDDWQVPDDLIDRIRRLDRTDAWAREIERTAEVRAILTDLIEELRSQWEAFTAADGYKSIRMKGDGWVDAARNRAEARLREVGGDV